MSGAIGIRVLIAGDVDASTVGGSALPPIFRGAPLRMLFNDFDKPNHWLYAKPDIRTVKDLKGRKVAVDGLGGTSESCSGGCWKKTVSSRPGRADSGDRAAAGPVCGAHQRSDGGHSLYVPAQLPGRRGRAFAARGFVKQDIASLTGCIVVRESSDAGLVEKLVRSAVKGHLYARNNRSGPFRFSPAL